MINYLKGKVQNQEGAQITLLPEGGVGYLVNLVGVGVLDGVSEIELFIHTAVRENDISLWGFKTLAELKFFRLLLGVSGVGMRTAQGLIETVGLAQIVAAIASDDPKSLKAPGVGKKTAERIIIDLRNKLDEFSDLQTGDLAKSIGKQNPVVEDAVAAVVSLGYTEQDVREVVKEIDMTDITEPQVLIKQILKYI